MRKKIVVLVAAVVLFLGGHLRAGDSVATPAGEQSNPIGADYGGVDLWSYPTGAVGASSVTLTEGGFLPGQYGSFFSTTTPNTSSRWLVYGAYFSTSNCGSNDYLEVTQSTGNYAASFSTANKTGAMRFYNISGSTSTSGATPNVSACSGMSYLRWPVRMYGNVFIRASNNGLVSQGLLYYKRPD